ncbi:molybdate transport system ATP-binding protein [Ruminiclostridium sufflavum DSM 19573]|uniref:Molybdate transport system ATP-binding protein n=1 Tax=Ruminiclostridium sufflavum DSM 19573 TaxID=1121337 RepID=A0A318XI91_9FIRM|nr:ATP-binding cassette domain-containing protein [Ruminiclostridium sufflavum]PYG84830.1 molybdate transport system ATP-binding protein [Ruminiclostridium sufflavum DSM 19573]
MSLYVNIKKVMGNFTLEVEFSANNEITALLGASGCGKSMTLKCIAGIETPDEGTIVLDGRVLFDSEQKINLSPQKRKVGYLFQNYALFPNMTVEENIGIGVISGKHERKEAVEEKIKIFYLEGLEKKRPHQLSGGQQQRVALARIMASEPDIIMLDEPFCALDSYLKWQLEQKIMDSLSGFQGTVLLVSHNRNEVYRFSKTVAVISDGRVETVSEKKSLFAAPKKLSAALLTGCKNISRVEKLAEHTLRAVDWDLELHTEKGLSDEIKYVGIRAHYLKYTEREDLHNVMTCEVAKVIENPFSYIIMLKNKSGKDDNSQIRWEIDKDLWRDISVKDSPIRIIFKEEDLLLLE